MQIETTRTGLDKLRADLAACFVFQGDKSPSGITDRLLRTSLARLMAEEKFEGRGGDYVLWYTNGTFPARRYAVIGLGKKQRFNPGSLRDSVANAVHRAEAVSARTLALSFPPSAGAGLSHKARIQAMAEGALLGNHKFDRYLNEPHKKARPLESVTLVSDVTPAAAREGIRVGRIAAEATCMARDLVCEPAGVLTPGEMSRRAKAVAKRKKLACRVLGKQDLKRLGMGAFLGVNAGSDQPPQLIHLVYKPARKARRRIALVGKGITFDSGGLNLKPTGSIETMKCDMAGSAAVLATMSALPDLKCPLEVHGIMAMTENMPGGTAQKPGDVVITMKGKTVEINNTDAEGRLVLCDAIAYAQQHKVDAIIDLATLTGACVVALGPLATGVMSNNRRLQDALLKAAETAGEKMWPLPLYDEYLDMLQSDIADLKNTGERWGGALTAGLFLREFVDEKIPWVHMDVAGSAWVDREIPLSRKGGSGAAVRTLLGYLTDSA
jgi:leucyl aminopeptidase